jgi:DNA uptake protein ComE-like DNA-binding protein
MPQGERQWDSEWLPVELRDAESEGTRGADTAGAHDDAEASVPEGAKPEPAAEEKPAEAVKKTLPERIAPEYQPKVEETNGGSEADWRVDRIAERAERVKTALQASGDRGDAVDERARAAAADAAMALVREAEAKARDAAEAADRMAAKVADLAERLATQEGELRQLRDATEVAERLSGRIESLSEQLASREAELKRLREEVERSSSEPEQPQAEPQAEEPRHQPREPGHRRQQTRPSALDLNSVGFDELCEMGLSVKQAARLIGYREQQGGFESPDDLDRLSGMPEKTIEALKNAAGG